VGQQAGVNLTSGNFNIDIGNIGNAGEQNTIRIGANETQFRTFIFGINDAAVTGTAVVVNNLGQLGVAPSAERFKDEIKPMDKASEAILALKPVSFHYKKELDPGGIPQFGLVAEEVENVNPDLVARDRDGRPFTVRYDAVNAMLLNEFLKEHRKVQKLEAALDAVNERLRDQDAKIQKVSAELELGEPASQMVANKP
jgi:predicted ribosome quality control (RQC) complex YloA/Tae2 family protein